MSAKPENSTVLAEAIKPTCFIIMPISDPQGYEEGHFKRVYEHIIKPACEHIGFTALRADDILKTNLIVLDVVKQIIESEMAICDLSAKNPNVLYELGIRQAFNKPVLLIKDDTTDRIFDIQGLRDAEYKKSLRVDAVSASIQAVSQALKETYDARDSNVNSFVPLLGIQQAVIPDKDKKISADTKLILSYLESFGKRITDLEIKFPQNAPAWKDFDFPDESSPATHIKLKDGNVTLGGDLYINGKIFGTLRQIRPDYIVVTNPKGDFVRVKVNSSLFSSLEAIPF
ncbi:hypothetical protein PCS_02465 [Desulfocurvibacter africanus PCS]|uniref:Nucleoside 2-deoxyribosyltransferase n=1 Tax=Desulfocurvibacter africanus PCS TaxID=1262666 RepID=M5PRK4_DESAF|nr:hypothetical protein [Desulfocurvibacter africanus]EMG36769.1 hypothetical protein PCS_02465 [Desulfocurvibacter africanus PCS]